MSGRATRDPCTQRGGSGGRGYLKAKKGALRRDHPSDTSALDFWPPELGGNTSAAQVPRSLLLCGGGPSGQTRRPSEGNSIPRHPFLQVNRTRFSSVTFPDAWIVRLDCPNSTACQGFSKQDLSSHGQGQTIITGPRARSQCLGGTHPAAQTCFLWVDTVQATELGGGKLTCIFHNSWPRPSCFSPTQRTCANQGHPLREQDDRCPRLNSIFIEVNHRRGLKVPGVPQGILRGQSPSAAAPRPLSSVSTPEDASPHSQFCLFLFPVWDFARSLSTCWFVL